MTPKSHQKEFQIRNNTAVSMMCVIQTACNAIGETTDVLQALGKEHVHSSSSLVCKVTVISNVLSLLEC
jgi:hypothetical protein